ncbi:MAG: putative photosynthetic complex assembly protein PuhE [Oscillochloridaceae bacterium umkhey_bin13]
MLSSLPEWPQIYLFPILTALSLWAGLTALVGLLNRRSPKPGRLALLFSVPLLILAHHELHATAADLSLSGAYRAFLAGTLIWAWHEMAFYSGILTGPWQKPCPPQASGFGRFGYALGTHVYHELAVLAELLLMLILLSGGPNMLGLLIFVLSWAMQHSAKLNVLLGIPSLNVALFPSHLRYLGSYWRPGPTSWFFTPSVSVFTLLALMLWLAAQAHSGDVFGVQLALLASLVSLGALEHWLLALPQRASQAVVPSRISE